MSNKSPNDGLSEINTVTISVLNPDTNTDSFSITAFDRFQYTQSFIIPTASWQFSLSLGDKKDISAAHKIFTQGKKIKIDIDFTTQCTGFIERVEKRQSNSGGTEFTVIGRDILGPVVTGCLDPQIKINANQTVLDFVSSILKSVLGSQFTSIHNSDDFNVNIITGLPSNAKAIKSIVEFSAEKNREFNNEGELTNIVQTTGKINWYKYPKKPDLKAIKLDILKPHIGEGCYQVLERVLTRLGLRLWAAADGSIVIDAPNFDMTPQQALFRKFNTNESNIIDGSVSINSQLQPSAIICQGIGSANGNSNVTTRVIAINELIAVSQDQGLNDNIDFILASYPGAKVLPLRDKLIPKAPNAGKAYRQKPYFYKDDESKTVNQLANFARKKLSEKQKEYITAEYTIEGFSQNGYVWGINTLVSIDDDFCDLHRDMWLIEKTFVKSRSEGTLSKLKFILPYTLELGEP